MSATPSQALLCPSSTCEVGANLLGIVQSDGSIAYSAAELKIDEGFVEVARQGRKPESRFRFSGPCHKVHCAQWRNGGCGVAVWAATVSSAQPGPELSEPPCSIRSRCRWYAQVGSSACRTCAYVITAVSEP